MTDHYYLKQTSLKCSSGDSNPTWLSQSLTSIATMFFINRIYDLYRVAAHG